MLERLFTQHSFDVVFSGLGTSRAQPELQATQQELDSYGGGFEHWLKKVDLLQNQALAKLAKRTEAGGGKFPRLVRIGAIGSDAQAQGSEENPWGYYRRYQGLADKAVLDESLTGGTVVLQPGGLNRGDDMRINRPWEQEKDQTNSLSVAHLAQVAVALGLRDFEQNLGGSWGRGDKIVVSDGDIRAFDFTASARGKNNVNEEL